MLKFSKRHWFAVTARFTVLLFALGNLTQPFATATFAAEVAASRSVAVVAFQSQANTGGMDLSSIATNSTVLALMEVPNTAVVPGEKVAQAVSAKAMKPPFNSRDLASVGQDVGANWVMSGSIVGAVKTSKTIKVDLETVVYDVGTGELLARTRTRGGADRKGPEADVWKNSTQKAATTAVKEMQDIIAMRGIVITKPKEGHVRISVGTDKHILPGAEIAFLSSGRPIAAGTVVTCDLGESLVRVESAEAAQNVEIGTDVRAIYNPSRSLVKDSSDPARSKKDEKKSSNSLILALVLIAAAVAAFGGHHGGGTTTPAPAADSMISSLTPSPATAPAVGGQSIITAVATDLTGSALATNGYRITFSTDKGTLDNAEDVTDGVTKSFTSTLTNDGTVGTAVVTVKIVDILDPKTEMVTSKVAVNFTTTGSSVGRRGARHRR